VRDDLRRPLQVATRTLAILAVLLWVVAAGIVAFVCYLSGLDRLRDIAVFKAFGVPTRTIVAGTVLHGVLLAGAAAVIALVAAALLVPMFPLPVAVSVQTSLQVLAAGVLIGICASALSVRQAVTVDPVLAFANT
jgi:putative ABC transport system permease protein